MRYLYSAMLTLCLFLPASAAPAPPQKDNPLEAARRKLPSLDKDVIINLLRIYAARHDAFIYDLAKVAEKPREFQELLEGLRQNDEKWQQLEQDWAAYKKLSVAPAPPQKVNPLEAARRKLPSLDEGVIINLLRNYAAAHNAFIYDLAKTIGKPEFPLLLEALRQHDEKWQKLEQDWAAYKKLAGIKSKRGK